MRQGPDNQTAMRFTPSCFSSPVSQRFRARLTAAAVRCLSWAAAAASVGLASAAQAQTAFHGQEVFDLSRRSIDLAESQLRLHQANERFGTMYSHVAITSRWAPGEFVMSDGTRLGGNLARNQVLLGGGWGDTETGLFFLGMQIDQIAGAGRYGQAEDTEQNRELFRPGGMSQFMSYLGASFYGVQASAGMLRNEMSMGDLEVNPYGTFGEAGSIRPGAPAELQTADYNPPDSLLFSLYDGHTGAFLSLAYGSLEERTATEWMGQTSYRFEHKGSGIQNVRFNLQPLQYYLPEWLGLPFASIARYDRPLAEMASQMDTDAAKRTTDFQIGADDVLEAGLRWRVLLNKADNFRMRVAEVGYVEEFRVKRFGLLFGARAMTVNRGTGYEPSAEAFLKGSFMRGSADVESRAIPSWFGAALSYSYNAPESQTFIALPKAHVFGIQVVYGPTELARPLVPLVRAVESRKARSRSSEDD